MDGNYDESGKPFALIYTDGSAEPVTYYYVLNLQGDVVALIDSTGAYVAQYTYNAWGEIITSSGTMADINPLRYRGYYYDTETGFYYLQSRYYDPVTHRFINADSYASTGQGIIGTNMFGYCRNNPVKRVDSAGFSDKDDSDGDGDIYEVELYGGGGGTSSYVYGGDGYYSTNSSTTSSSTSGSSIGGSSGSFGGYNTINSRPSAGRMSGVGNHSIIKTVWRGIQHWFGCSSPKKIKISGGCYTQLDSSGGIHSYTVYNKEAKQVLRVDFKGRPHAGVLPHIHVYGYNAHGQLIFHRVYDVHFNVIG